MIVLYVIRAKLRIVFDISSSEEEFSHLLSLSEEKKGARGKDETDGRARHRVPVAGKTPCGARKSTFRKALEYSAPSTATGPARRGGRKRPAPPAMAECGSALPEKETPADRTTAPVQ